MASLKSIEIDKRTIEGAAPGVRRVKISLSDKRQALMDLAKMRACCRPIDTSIRRDRARSQAGAQDRH